MGVGKVDGGTVQQTLNTQTAQQAQKAPKGSSTVRAEMAFGEAFDALESAAPQGENILGAQTGATQQLGMWKSLMANLGSPPSEAPGGAFAFNAPEGTPLLSEGNIVPTFYNDGAVPSGLDKLFTAISERILANVQTQLANAPSAPQNQKVTPEVLQLIREQVLNPLKKQVASTMKGGSTLGGAASTMTGAGAGTGTAKASGTTTTGNTQTTQGAGSGPAGPTGSGNNQAVTGVNSGGSDSSDSSNDSSNTGDSSLFAGTSGTGSTQPLLTNGVITLATGPNFANMDPDAAIAYVLMEVTQQSTDQLDFAAQELQKNVDMSKALRDLQERQTADMNQIKSEVDSEYQSLCMPNGPINPTKCTQTQYEAWRAVNAPAPVVNSDTDPPTINYTAPSLAFVNGSNTVDANDITSLCPQWTGASTSANTTNNDNPTPPPVLNPVTNASLGVSNAVMQDLYQVWQDQGSPTGNFYSWAETSPTGPKLSFLNKSNDSATATANISAIKTYATSSTVTGNTAIPAADLTQLTSDLGTATPNVTATDEGIDPKTDASLGVPDNVMLDLYNVWKTSNPAGTSAQFYAWAQSSTGGAPNLSTTSSGAVNLQAIATYVGGLPASSDPATQGLITQLQGDTGVAQAMLVTTAAATAQAAMDSSTDSGLGVPDNVMADVYNVWQETQAPPGSGTSANFYKWVQGPTGPGGGLAAGQDNLSALADYAAGQTNQSDPYVVQLTGDVQAAQQQAQAQGASGTGASTTPPWTDGDGNSLSASANLSNASDLSSTWLQNTTNLLDDNTDMNAELQTEVQLAQQTYTQASQMQSNIMKSDADAISAMIANLK